MEKIIDFKPSQVYIDTTNPLTATFGKAELEQAVALLVLAMYDHGNEWKTLQLEDLYNWTIKCRSTEPRPPVNFWSSNPFFRPDFKGLIDRGYVTNEADALSFTEAGLEKLRPWVRT